MTQITNRLKAEKEISRSHGLCSQCGESFKLVNRVARGGAAPGESPSAAGPTRTAAAPDEAGGAAGLGLPQFEELARLKFGELFQASFRVGSVRGVPEKFDLVDEQKGFVGDAKYLTMVRGRGVPPATFSVVAEHVWLLEKTRAKKKFMVFGNDERVPQQWLAEYGHLVGDVEFYFMTDGGEIRRLA
ncbi:MAG: hypothetical protein MUP14_08340 [Dehalococcoidia bacterium]|nr:hypothetical protein [Dehalococcoidia bacterium]